MPAMVQFHHPLAGSAETTRGPQGYGRVSAIKVLEARPADNREECRFESRTSHATSPTGGGMSNVDYRTLKPGTPGVSHGSGLAGEIIRHATESWAGHAFIYVGSGQLIQAHPPVATIDPADIYDDAIWFHEMPITDEQRRLAINRAHALVGTPYDWPGIVGFALEIMKLKTETQLDPVFKSDPWRVCSALVTDCLGYAKFPLEWRRLGGANDINPDPNLVSPAMLLNLATVEGWV